VETGYDRQATEDYKPARCVCMAWLNISQAILLDVIHHLPAYFPHSEGGYQLDLRIWKSPVMCKRNQQPSRNRSRREKGYVKNLLVA
jgi:hypothetical protein